MVLEAGRRVGLPSTTTIVLVLVLTPLAAAAISLVVGPAFDGYQPSNDHAWTEFRVRDVGRHGPLVGLYSRDGWSHPGPLSFYLMAPFYWLTGQSSVGPHLGALAINGTSLVGIALVARRRGGDALMILALLGCALLLRSSGAQFVQDPWNLWVTTLPYALFVLVCWSLACGERWALPVSALLATFLDQTHVGYLLLGGPTLLWGLTGFAWVSRRPDRRPERIRVVKATALTAGLLALLWLPPLIDVVQHAPSNLRVMRDWYSSPTGFKWSHTVIEGVRVIAAQLTLRPEWLVTKSPMDMYQQTPHAAAMATPWLLLLVAVPVALLWRRDRAGRNLVVTLAVTAAANVYAVVRTLGPLYDYRMRPTWVLAMLTCVAAAWSLGLTLGPRRRLTAAAVGVLALVCAVNVVTAVRVGIPHAGDSASVASLTEQVLDALETDPDLRDRHGRVVIAGPDFQWEGIPAGVALQLEKRGIDVAVTDLAVAIGEHRRLGPDDEVRAVLYITRDGGVDAQDAQANRRRIAYWEAPDDRQPSQVGLFMGDAPGPVRAAVFLEESSV